MQVAQLLPHRPAIVKQVLNIVAHHIFTAVVFVVIILAFIKGVRDLLPVMRNHGAIIGQTGVAAAFRIAMQIGHQIQTRLVGDAPGQAGHQRVTFLLQWPKLRVRVTRHPAQTCRDAIVIIQRPGDVKRRAALVIVSGKQLHFATRIKRRLTRRQRHNTARRGTAIQHGSRAAHHFDIFEEPRVNHQRTV